MRRVVLSLLLCACSPYDLPPASRHELPQRLSELRGYTDLRSGAVGLRPYRPSFALWSDGASKRRWIRLPEGEAIDTSDLDAWRFPVGTELWKEFSVDGKRIETRVLRKVSREDSGWAAMTYAWNAAQDEAFAAPDGVHDALGTRYDIPSARTCMACHGGRPERVLGFGAVQLAHEPAEEGELTLDRLVAEHRLSEPPRAPVRVPADAAAVGYLHANCAHCHNGARPPDATHFRPPRTVDFGLRVEDLGSVASTRAYATATRYAMGASTNLIVQRMTRQGAFRRRMPPLATERIDQEGVALVAAWLAGLGQ